MSYSVIASGSDACFEYVCEPCDDEHEHNEATGYCKECRQFLCKTCVKYHRRQSNTKGHAIVSGHEMSKFSKVKAVATSGDVVTDLCPKHENECIKHYCSNHSQLACDKCLSEDHMKCRNVSQIQDFSSGVKDSQELVDVRGDLHRLISSIADDEDNAKEKLETTVQIFDNAAESITAVQKAITDYMKHIESNLLKDIELIKQRDLGASTQELTSYQDLLSKLGKILHDFDEKEVQNKENGLFVAMKQAKLQIAEVKKERRHTNEVVPTKYSVEKDAIIKTVYSALEDSLKLNIQEGQQPNLTMYADDLNVRYTDEAVNCYIGGMLLLPDGQIALADMENVVVKLLDPNQNSITTRATMSSSPYDIALISNQELAVTLGKEKKVQILRLYDLAKLRSFRVGGTCKGIAFDKGSLFIVCQKPNSIQVMDVNGRQLREIAGLFSMPSRITIIENGIMYVTDHKSDDIVVLAEDGSQRARITSADIKQPLGVTFNREDGCVYVVGWASNSIHKLTASGDLIKILFDKTDEVQKPVAIVCKGKKLFVSFDGSTAMADKIKTFDLQ